MFFNITPDALFVINSAAILVSIMAVLLLFMRKRALERRFADLQAQVEGGGLPPSPDALLLDSDTEAFRKIILLVEELASSRPFVSLKWLHQSYLDDDEYLKTALHKAVDAGLLEQWKRQNPNNPDFPTTCVRLNLQHPLVQKHARTRIRTIDG
jgi:hypothetical protein